MTPPLKLPGSTIRSGKPRCSRGRTSPSTHSDQIIAPKSRRRLEFDPRNTTHATCSESKHEEQDRGPMVGTPARRVGHRGAQSGRPVRRRQASACLDSDSVHVEDDAHLIGDRGEVLAGVPPTKAPPSAPAPPALLRKHQLAGSELVVGQGGCQDVRGVRRVSGPTG